MACLPTFEELLFEVHRSLGLNTSQRKKKFVDLEMQLDNHLEAAREMLAAVFEALNMDHQAAGDALANCSEWANFLKALELSIWTGNARQQHVLWYLLAYVYVPGLARLVAFWTLQNLQDYRLPLDAGMRGSKFWFLPRWDKRAGTMKLPVAGVIEWLLELLGDRALQDAVSGLGRDTDGDRLDHLRTLQGWRLQGFTPKSAKKIEHIFSDDSLLEFHGAFHVKEEHSGEERFQAALDYVKRKQLGTEELQSEIRLSAKRLESILNGTAPTDEKQSFVRSVSLRYAAPDMRTVRQRFLVARLVQHGYGRLLQFLCPGVEVNCVDPARNKVLQLIELFTTTYNLTVTAWNRGGGMEEQDAWFEANLPPWDKGDLLLSILPSINVEARSSLLAKRLTRKFISLSAHSVLEDLVPWDEESAKLIVAQRLRLIKKERDEDQRLDALVQRVRAASPWRVIEQEDSYWVVVQFAQQVESAKIREIAVRRMRHLATTPEQVVGATVIELGSLLDCRANERPKDVLQRVQVLLDAAEQSPGYAEWRAPLLRFRAKHHLFQNQFGAAMKHFNDALEACSEKAFGPLRGEVAKEAFATEIAEAGFIPQNQERYYRNVLAYTDFHSDFPSFPDFAAECEGFFWDRLYQPYLGYQRQGPVTIQFKAAMTEAFGLIKRADWDGLHVWMRRHEKSFRKKTLKEARRNSLLLQWLKMLRGLERQLAEQAATIQSDFEVGIQNKLRQYIKNLRVAIGYLLDAWPEHANIADFKAQTPLMIVANDGDVELTRRLAPISDVDAQDYLGRTALHAAIAGGSPHCVAALLERNPDVAKVTVEEGNNVLHTAVRFGSRESARLVLEEFPGLASKRNEAGQTPPDMARDVLANLGDWQKLMSEMNRRTGSKEDFQSIIALLETESDRHG